MKKILSSIIMLCSALLFTQNASAVDVDVEIRAGVNLVNMSTDYVAPTFDTELSEPTRPVDPNTFVGFSAGLGVNIDIWKGLGLYTGADYSRRNIKADWGNLFYMDDLTGGQVSEYNTRLVYLAIPIMPSYRFNIPIVNKIIRPMVYTGPVVNIRLEGTNFGGEVSEFLVDWRFGIGIKFLNHWQLNASYNIPLNNTLKFTAKPVETVGECHAKTKYWAFTIGYSF